MAKRVKIKDGTSGTFPSLSDSFESGAVPPDSHGRSPIPSPDVQKSNHGITGGTFHVPQHMSQHDEKVGTNAKKYDTESPNKKPNTKTLLIPERQTSTTPSTPTSISDVSSRTQTEETQIHSHDERLASGAHEIYGQGTVSTTDGVQGDRRFDLNIERVLEDWDIHHAIREIVANAIDEQVLTGTKDIQIQMDGGTITIRDFGRGIRYEHLTQNENTEKISSNKQIVGKFGVGLKDALATFDRHGIGITIRSRHGEITISKSSKHEFEDVITLHAVVSPASNPAMQGTVVVLTGCAGPDLEKAMNLFLRFSDERRLDATKYGEVLERKQGRSSRIYINGVAVAEEDNFLFSYNITSLTDAMKKSLNRERTHVGRGAYTGRVKSILLSSKNEKVLRSITDDLQNYGAGTQHDEIKWQDVSEHACSILSASKDVIYVTADNLQRDVKFVDYARRDGLSVVVVPSAVEQKIRGGTDSSGSPLRNVDQYVTEFNESFKFEFVEPSKLSASERFVYDKTESIFRLAGGRPENVRDVFVSKTMREEGHGTDAGGIWEPDTGRIIIKRTKLNSVESYAGTLLHEMVHAISGTEDMTIDFENELTHMIGKISAKGI